MFYSYTNIYTIFVSTCWHFFFLILFIFYKKKYFSFFYFFIFYFFHDTWLMNNIQYILILFWYYFIFIKRFSYNKKFQKISASARKYIYIFTVNKNLTRPRKWNKIKSYYFKGKLIYNVLFWVEYCFFGYICL